MRPKSLLLGWWEGMHPPHKSATGIYRPPGFGTPGYVFIIVVYIGGHGTLQKYRGTGTRYFAKISTAVPVLSN